MDVGSAQWESVGGSFPSTLRGWRPRQAPCSQLMVDAPCLDGVRRPCHNQDLVFEAFDKRNIGEDAIISPRDRLRACISYYSEGPTSRSPDISNIGRDPLALVDSTTPIENNIGLLETKFAKEEVFVFVFPEDVTESNSFILVL
ncbi:hypothetical protein Tco_1430024 [Tanacetum coccineum]